MSSTSIYIAEFDSEEKLKDQRAFSLPSVNLFNKSDQLLKQGMDGLMIAMAEEGDLLVTEVPLPEAYLHYWAENFCRVGNFTPSMPEQAGPEPGRPAPNHDYPSLRGRPAPDSNSPAPQKQDSRENMSIYRRLQLDPDARRLFIGKNIQNYALVPGYYEMCSALGLQGDEPPLSVITELNSKAYSNDLKYRLDLPARGIRLRSIPDYERRIGQMLEDCGKVVIKDVMGVSGKGMLVIDSAGMADRLLTHFRRQEAQGRTQFDFLLEPLLNRTTDFSCLLQIDRSGGIRIDGYQQNESRGFSYLGSGPLENSRNGNRDYERILSSGYPETVKAVGAALAEKGYHGCVCIDSMIADHDQVIPLLEINPRMSMSRFNLNLQKRLGRPCRLRRAEGRRIDDAGTGGSNDSGGRTGRPDGGNRFDENGRSCGRDGGSLEQLLRDLDAEGLLFTRPRGSGVIPLAPGTWNRPGAAGQRVRVYYVIAYETEREYEKISAAWLSYCSRRLCTGALR